MITFRIKEYSDKLTQGLYQINKAKNAVHNFGMGMQGKVVDFVSKKANNPQAKVVFNRAAKIDSTQHTNLSAARQAITQRKELTPKNIAKSAMKGVIAPVAIAANIVANPGPALDKVARVAVKNPCYATGELLDDATTAAGVYFGSPAVKAISLNTPLRAIGAGAEGIAKIFPSYKKNRKMAARNYDNGKMSGFLKKLTLKRVLEKGSNNIPMHYMGK